MATEATAVAAEAVAMAAAMAVAAGEMIWKPSALLPAAHTCSARQSCAHGRHRAGTLQVHVQGVRVRAHLLPSSRRSRPQGCPATGKCDDTPPGECRRTSRDAKLHLLSSMSSERAPRGWSDRRRHLPCYWIITRHMIQRFHATGHLPSCKEGSACESNMFPSAAEACAQLRRSTETDPVQQSGECECSAR